MWLHRVIEGIYAISQKQNPTNLFSGVLFDSINNLFDHHRHPGCTSIHIVVFLRECW